MKKKVYTTPQLTVHGSVEKITLKGGRGGPPGGGPPGGGPPGGGPPGGGPPGHISS